MTTPENPQDDGMGAVPRVRHILKDALGNYLLPLLKSDKYYPNVYAKRIADIIQANSSRSQTSYATEAYRKEEMANKSEQPDMKDHLRSEVDGLLRDNVDMRDWLRIMKSDWGKLQYEFPHSQRAIVNSYVAELIAYRNELSHERSHPLYRFVDTSALLLQAIKSSAADDVLEIARSLTPYHPDGSDGLNGSAKTMDGETERFNPRPANGEYFLVVISETGESSRVSIPTDRDRIIIGRGSNSHINIQDVRVSRAHAQITRTSEGKFTIADLYSANGTRLNDEPLTFNSPASWMEGEIVTIGSTSLILRRSFD